ncbi:MAG TPA: hypothetical protein VG457_02700 [Planctomycetota bacterium]|jgi:hypothetical protein|nr:hypothetical protein [Planctomycetota bacterium]
MRSVGIAVFLLGAAAGAQGDTLTFPSGGQMKGVVLSKNDDAVVVRIRVGLMTVDPAQVTSIEKDAPAFPRRLTAWEACFATLRTRPWGPELRPQKAVIIDSGLYKYVPYTRDVSGAREFSIYGDPDAPAGFEIGLTKSLASSVEAQKEAVALLSELLSDPRDREVLAGLKLSDGSKADREGLSFEVEKGTNADGADTWWLSVYSPGALDLARVSEKDLPKNGLASESSNTGGDTTVAGSKDSGSRETQETITPFGSEPDKTPHRRRYTGGGGGWGNWWHHHGTMHHGGTPHPKGN